MRSNGAADKPLRRSPSMKKLMTLVALLAVGGWIAGCGEEKKEPPKPGPKVLTGPPSGETKKGIEDAKKGKDGKTGTEDETATDENKGTEDKDAEDKDSEEKGEEDKDT